MSKTTWVGLTVVLIAVAVPLGASGIRRSPTALPAAAPVTPVEIAATDSTDDSPDVHGEPPPEVPTFTPPTGVPPGTAIWPGIDISPPTFHPSTVPSIVPPPVRPPIGLGGPGIGSGGRGAFVIPR